MSRKKKNLPEDLGDVKYNYLRKGYCEDDAAPILPDSTQGLRRLLEKMDIKASHIARTNNFQEKQALCRLLQEQQAEILEPQGSCDITTILDLSKESKEIDPSRLIRLRHGPDKPNIHCYDVVELVDLLSENPKLRTLFSEFQLQRIQRNAETAQRDPTERSCNESDGNKASCLKTSPRCAFNEWSVFGRLFSASSSSTRLRDKECYPTFQFVDELAAKCSNDTKSVDKQTLELVLFDMLSRSFVLQHVPQAETDLSIIEIYALSNRIETLKNVKRAELHELTVQSLCSLLQDNLEWYKGERTGWWVGDKIEITIPQALGSSEGFLELLGWNAIPLQSFVQFWSALQPILLRMWKDQPDLLAQLGLLAKESWVPRLLHFAVNAFFGGYSILASWASFFFLTPGGWILLNKIRKDRSLAGILGITLSLLLDGSSPVLKALQQLHLPTETVSRAVLEFAKSYPGGSILAGQLASDLTQGAPKVLALSKKISTSLKNTTAALIPMTM